MAEKVKKKKVVDSGSAKGQQITMLLVILAICVLWTIMSPFFLTVDNFVTVVHTMCVTTVAGYAMTICLINGGVDLSLGFTICLSGITTAMTVYDFYGKKDSTGSIAIALLIGIGTGVLVGLINGIVVAKFGLPPYLSTLAMQMILRGLAYLLPGLGPVYLSTSTPFREIAQTRFGDVFPITLIYVIVFGLVLWFFMRKTVLGRRFYAIGSNSEAARLSGINVANTRICAYIVTSMMASIAGILQAARTNCGSQANGVGMEGDATVAAVIGGTSMGGGHGSLFGCIIGGLFMTLLKNGMNLLKINANWQFVLIGIFLIVSVIIDQIRREREMNKIDQ
jgi:ribose/xylose/arabinose/galactoside ABC-type transport system permease subunit